MPKSEWTINGNRAAVLADKNLLAAANLVNDVFVKEEIPMSEEKKPMVKAGALWMNTAKSGQQYLSGSLADGTKVIAFMNPDVLDAPDNKKPYITLYVKN